MQFKSTPFLYLFMISFCLLTFQSCLQDECEGTQTYIQYTPVWKTAEEFRAEGISTLSAKELTDPGTIYFYQNYILINERGEGIHIINNQDVENPNNIGFIEIPGNQDMAVKGNMLYADNYVDLLTIDITDIQNATLVKRVEEVFRPISFNDQDGYLLFYEETDVTETIDCSDPRWGSFSGKGGLDQQGRGNIWAPEGGFDPVLVQFDNNAIGGSSSAPQGIGGSMARFTLAHDHLYVIDESTLNIFDLDDITCPDLVNTVDVGWGIETIFPYEDKLFIGANTGMHIFSATDPANPIHRSTFQHAQACDPVVVSGDLAYVTLRGGTPCQNFDNQLDVIDVSDLDNPVLLETYPMDNPHGLAVKEEVLFLCDGDSGLRVFDISDITKIDENQLDRKKNFFAYDAIALPSDVVLVIGEDGFYQFDASDPDNLKELSVISVENK